MTQHRPAWAPDEVEIEKPSTARMYDFYLGASTEAARLNRAGELSPGDYEAVQYGRKPKGATWTAQTILGILTGYASLGYLTHNKLAVLDEKGHPFELCDGLWDEATRLALVEKVKPRREGSRAPKGKRLLSGRVECGNCGTVHYLSGRPAQWRCTGRVRGLQVSAECQPSPGMLVTKIDALVTDYFLTKFGPTPLTKRIFDPGSGHAARIAQVEANRARLQSDRDAGLYDAPEDEAKFRKNFKRMGEELAELKAMPVREAQMRTVETGETVADQWNRSDVIERREMLASYGVKVEMYPEGHSPRLWIHTLAPGALNEARWAFFDDEQQDREYAYAEAFADIVAHEQAASDALPDAVETDPDLWPAPRAEADHDAHDLVAVA
jgi:site-specific DNA recombinase